MLFVTRLAHLDNVRSSASSSSSSQHGTTSPVNCILPHVKRVSSRDRPGPVGEMDVYGGKIAPLLLEIGFGKVKLMITVKPVVLD